MSYVSLYLVIQPSTYELILITIIKNKIYTLTSFFFVD